jgi:putative membrane protein
MTDQTSNTSGRRASALFSEGEQQRIADAITGAEQGTSGEIVAVVANDSGRYLYVPFMWAALVALLVPWPLVYFTWWPVQWIYLIQLAAFLVLLTILMPQPVRLALVPRSVKRDRAHRHAVEQFLAQGLHTTASRTGVLIFVSVAERYAEVLADTGIDAKVAPGTWQEIVDGLTARIGEGRAADGFVEAIGAAGRHLATHFPPGTADPNELPNKLIVLD